MEEETSFRFSYVEEKTSVPEPVVAVSDRVAPEPIASIKELTVPSPIKHAETSSQTDISYDHNVTLDDKNISTDEPLMDVTVIIVYLHHF